LSCDKNRCNAPCVPGENQTQSCSYCDGKLNCTGIQTRKCKDDCTWDYWSSCSIFSCTCQVGYCGVTDASQCCPTGTYYKRNEWSKKENCCSSLADCVDYYGNCIRSGEWGNANNLGPLDLCKEGEWRVGFCVATNTTCLFGDYTTVTTGCSIYELGCPPYDYHVVIALGRYCDEDADCPGYSPITHTRYKCDCPLRECGLHNKQDYTCTPAPSCYSKNYNCDDYWCCNVDSCVEVGTIVNSEGISYLCVHIS
jgi:hypothetical protein